MLVKSRTDFVRIEHCEKHSFPKGIHSLILIDQYYKEYYQEKFTSLSFLVLQDNETVGLVLCSVLDKKITHPDGAVMIYLFTQEDRQKNILYTSILEYIDEKARQYGCNEIIIKDRLPNGCLSVLGTKLFNQRYQSRLTFEMAIDYKNFSESGFQKNIRKSYKSLIHWGRKNLKITYVNKDSLCFENFCAFQDFHYKVAKRKTRSDESWKRQYEIIQQGFGELILAYYNGNLAAGSLYVDHGEVSIYFTGVYERDLFNFGISHFLLYDGICRSYGRGKTRLFSLGYFDTDIQDPKWRNIQFFKKGFCDELTPIVLWSKAVIA